MTSWGRGRRGEGNASNAAGAPTPLQRHAPHVGAIAHQQQQRGGMPAAKPPHVRLCCALLLLVCLCCCTACAGHSSQAAMPNAAAAASSFTSQQQQAILTQGFGECGTQQQHTCAHTASSSTAAASAASAALLEPIRTGIRHSVQPACTPLCVCACCRSQGAPTPSALSSSSNSGWQTWFGAGMMSSNSVMAAGGSLCEGCLLAVGACERGMAASAQ